MLLHGEEKVTFHKSFLPGETYVVKEVISDVIDKKSGAVFLLDSKIYEKTTGDHCATIRGTIFIRGIGGFGYKGKVKVDQVPAIPKAAPDSVAVVPMESNAANLYRIN